MTANDVRKQSENDAFQLGQKRGDLNRRVVLGALAGSGVTAAGWAAAQRSVEDQGAMLVEARRFLEILNASDGRERLRALGNSAPSVAGFASVATGRTDSQASLPQVTANGARLTPGTYLLDHQASVLDAVVEVVDLEGQPRQAFARFTFDKRREIRSRLLSVRFSAKSMTGLVTSVASFGATGARGPDASRQVQTAYDELAAAGGGTLFFPPGDYAVQLKLTSRNVAISGAGMGCVLLHPARSDEPVIQALYNSGSWSPVTLSDFTIVGPGSGTGFLAGHVDYQRGDEYSGRTVLRGVRFEGFDHCIKRPAGQIGLWIDGCIFEAARFHIAATGHEGPGDPMHAGNMTVRDSHFQGANTAAIHLDSAVAGSGQIIFDSCIFESNPGYVLLVDRLNNTAATPSLVLRSCWNESNATASEVAVGGLRSKPVFAALSDTGMVLFEDTPVGPLRLKNATVTTQHCPLDSLTIEADRSSSVKHFAARGFGSFQPAGLVESLAAAYQFLPNRNLFFSMRPRQSASIPSTAQLLIGSNADESVMLDAATGRTVEKGGDGWRVAPGQRLRLSHEANAPPECWLVWLFQYRLSAGNPLSLSLTGGYGVGAASLTDREPRCLSGMTWLPEGAKGLGFYVEAPNGPGVFTIELVKLVAFQSRQAAIDFINGGDPHDG